MHMAQSHFNHLHLENSTGVSPKERTQASSQRLMESDSVTPIITPAPPGWKERGPSGYEAQYRSFSRRHQGEGQRQSTNLHEALSRR